MPGGSIMSRKVDRERPCHITLPVPRKRRAREHILADLSVNYLERFILEAGHTVERQMSEYGYDLTVAIFDENGFFEPGHADFQLKASESLTQNRTGKSFVQRLRVEDYHLWIHEPLPVFLVQFDAGERRAFWLHIQKYFAEDAIRDRVFPCGQRGRP
jgi:hypothetical protein